jgi:amino acid efflux transporter
MATSLHQSLGVFRGAALLMNIVIGAGLLTLPGLAEQAAGDQAPAAWLLCTAAALPLLAVFIALGRRYPDAGGIASYARRGFGPLGERTASLLLLGAVIFGLPSIALSGGHYLAAAFGGSPHGLALALLLCAVLPHLLPGAGAARAMAWVASTVLAAVIAFLAVGLLDVAGTGGVPFVVARFDPGVALAPFAMLFFAFTGWEVGAGIAEEFHRPERDFPRAMALSFAVTCMLYFAIAYVTQRTELHGHYATPFVEIVQPMLGNSGAAAVAVTASVIVFANLAGAVWGISRLVFSLARDGALPAVLAETHGGRPLWAVAATVAALAGVLLASACDLLSLGAMLALAGQNFILLYGIAAAALAILARTWTERALAAAVILIVTALLIGQGTRLIYPLGLCAAAALIEAVQWWRRPTFAE